MREKGNSSKNLIIAVAVLAVVGAAGYFYSTRDRISDSELLVGVSVTDVATVEGDVLSALRDLRTIRLDEQIFSDPVFRSLSNFSTALVPQPAGRQNPFAPLSSFVPAAQ